MTAFLHKLSYSWRFSSLPFVLQNTCWAGNGVEDLGMREEEDGSLRRWGRRMCQWSPCGLVIALFELSSSLASIRGTSSLSCPFPDNPGCFHSWIPPWSFSHQPFLCTDLTLLPKAINGLSGLMCMGLLTNRNWKPENFISMRCQGYFRKQKCQLHPLVMVLKG